MLFTGVLLAMETAVFLVGWYLRHPSAQPGLAPVANRGRRHWLPLGVYLGGSIGIGLLAALAFIAQAAALGPLGYLIGQPCIPV